MSTNVSSEQTTVAGAAVGTTVQIGKSMYRVDTLLAEGKTSPAVAAVPRRLNSACLCLLLLQGAMPLCTEGFMQALA